MLRAIWNSLLGTQGPSTPSRRLAAQLNVEALEDRAVPAGMLNLATHGAFGAVGAGLFQQWDGRPTGTGTLNSFVRIQKGPGQFAVNQGLNTNARPLQFDENKSAQYTHALRLDEVPVVILGGVRYRQFALDINQKSSQPLLSLDALQIFAGGAGNLTGYDPAAKTLPGATSVYDMDAGEDNWVLLDYSLNSGSGSGDMLLYIPDQLFAQAGGQFVYLYSRFGEHFAVGAGFQEWGLTTGGASGTISGTKFNDRNGDGNRDADEEGLKDWVIFIDANANGTLDDGETYAVTDENGNYSFDNLATGLGTYSTYLIREVQQVGWVHTTDDPIAIILTTPGQVVTDVDFGNRRVDEVFPE